MKYLGQVRMRAPSSELRDVQVLDIMLDEEEPFLKVLQSEGWKMLAIKNVVEADLKTRDYTEGGKLASCRRRIEQARLRAYSQFPGHGRRLGGRTGSDTSALRLSLVVFGWDWTGAGSAERTPCARWLDTSTGLGYVGAPLELIVCGQEGDSATRGWIARS